MTKKLLLAFATLALAVASAKSYRITLFEPSLVGGAELKPGDYKVEVVGEKAVIRGAGQSAEVPVTIQNGERKHASTTVRYENGDGKYRIREINLGGTTMKLVVN